ncbi:hypothetical protein JTB14_037774 [Gonioctena quinquepunctata]|nr:hypothetical protein JTB14_037774 [Gonioctena quinquepunctata]
MYTVLESLDRPWEHSYASELVTKICGACPDLNVEKWLNALKFSKNLIQELKPSCIEFCIKELSVVQLFQVVTCLVSPLPIMKVLLPENNCFESSSVKQNVLSVLLEMLKSMDCYMNYFKHQLNEEDLNRLKSHFAGYISRHFPDGLLVLKDWETKGESALQLLEIIFDILECYKNLAPALLDTLSTENAELSELLKKLDDINFDAENSSSLLRVKIINTFFDFDSSKFSTESELFSVVVPLLYKYYHHNTNSTTLTVLNKIFRNTGIFDGCSYEINVWINAVLNLKKFDENVAQNLVDIFKLTNQNLPQYLETLSSLQTINDRGKDYSDIVQNLLNVNFTTDVKKVLIRHRYLSPTILGLFEYFSQAEVTKALRVYSNFALINLLHMQTQIEPIVQIISESEFSSKSLKEYASCWIECREIVGLKKLKGKSDTLERFSEEFLFGKMENFLTKEQNLHADLSLNLLDACIFYLCNLSTSKALTGEIFENCQKFAKHVINKEV